MARAIEKGATYLDKLCHKLYDEPKGRGFQVDGKCRRCGGPLMTYYCEDRLHLIACEKCGTLALTKAVSPQVAANLTLRQPTLTPPNEPLTLEDAKKERYIWFTPLNDWAKVTSFGVLFFGSEELMSWETLCEEWGYRFKAYRRPPEGEA